MSRSSLRHSELVYISRAALFAVHIDVDVEIVIVLLLIINNMGSDKLARLLDVFGR